jgi:WhiB family transcriptional regulator, redox-sensing transcriptional regulator
MKNRTGSQFSDGAAGPLLPLLPSREDLEWQDGALCTEVSPDLWFPEKGAGNEPAKRVCRSCEVRIPCLQYALENNERFGIFGGMSEPERRAARKTGMTAAEAIAAQGAARMRKARRTAANNQRLARQRQHRSEAAARIEAAQAA